MPEMAALPGSIPDPSPLGRRHFPDLDHVSAKHKPITVSLLVADKWVTYESRLCCNTLQCEAGSFVKNKN